MSEIPCELRVEQLRRICDPKEFSFQSTRELTPIPGLIEQERPFRAIRFGLGITGMGYNIYVAGLTGTGKNTAIKAFLQEAVRGGPLPQDWIYTHNFQDEDQPIAIGLPAGMGRVLKKGMEEVIAHLKVELPKAFESKDHEQQIHDILNHSREQEQNLFEELEKEAREQRHLIQVTKTGISLIPTRQGEPLSKQQFESLPEEERRGLNHHRQELQSSITDFSRKVRAISRESKKQIEETVRQVGLFVIENSLIELKEKYAKHSAVTEYLHRVREDILDNLNDFLGEAEKQEEKQGQEDSEADPLLRYRINVLVDHTGISSPPVIIETNPTYYNLFGRLERRARLGTLLTDFTKIKAGSLIRANGGYLVVNAQDLLGHFGVWEALKRAVKNKEIRIEDLGEHTGLVPTMGLKPQAIPFDCKILMAGSQMLYHMLYAMDEEFRKIFKVKADFDSQMPYDPEHLNAYANFVGARCHEEGLVHFDPSGVAVVVEYGARLVEDQNKLSARFSDLADIIREAGYIAGGQAEELVRADHVLQAIEEKEYRSNLMEERLRQYIAEGTLIVDVAGSAIGQVNGLAVVDIGDYRFGKPSRITAKTFLGRSGVMDIERDAKLSGRIYNKGFLILSGYLGWKYAQKTPLTLSASICFEQSYEGIDGDSASSTELYALLSSLAELPIKQGLAVTGSVSQHGEIQPIGGINQKIEGFYEICRLKGLTREQGVLIPWKNIENLMLKEAVAAAVRQGNFHIYPIKTVDDGITLLTGVAAGTPQADGIYPEGTVHHLVAKKLDGYLAYYHMMEGPPEEEPEGEDTEGSTEEAGHEDDGEEEEEEEGEHSCP